jgi:hypothetical protein
MNVKVTTPATETSGPQLRTSTFAKVGIWLAAAWLSIDWKCGLNLGQLGFVATFFLAPIGLFCGANALGRIRDDRESGRILARWTLTLGALGTAFAFCLLVTR